MAGARKLSEDGQRRELSQDGQRRELSVDGQREEVLCLLRLIIKIKVP